jgi:hypothetical protein
MTEDWIVKDLIRKVYRRYPERFSGRNRCFSLRQGGKNRTRERGSGVDRRVIGA